jgi:hypothetical protein
MAGEDKDNQKVISLQFWNIWEGIKGGFDVLQTG